MKYMELDFDDVVTYSEYMQLVSSGYLEDTTNTQADLEVNAQVTEVQEGFIYYDLSYSFNRFMKG